MREFGVIFAYELKKIFQRRLAQVTVAVLLLIGLFMGSIPLWASLFMPEPSGDSYATLSRRREAAAALAGRALDDELLDEMRAAYARHPGLEGKLPLDDPGLAYDGVYDLVWSSIGMSEAKTADAGRFYDLLRQRRERYMDEQALTPAERAWWQEQEAKVEYPIRYFYSLGPSNLLSIYYTLGVLAVFLAALCLAGVFADEQQRRTDQLLLSSRRGRGTLYLAKLAAGAAVSAGGGLALFLAVLLPLSVFYGLDGWDAAAQLHIGSCLYPATMGQMVLLELAVYLSASLLFGAAALFFSELFRSSLASMALLAGGMLASLMLPEPPARLRLLAQLWEMQPNLLLSPWNMVNYRLVPWFGGYLTELQAAPVLYLLAAALLAALGWLHYRRGQIAGR